MAGGVIRHVPALSPEQYLSGIEKAVKHSVPAPSVMIVSYPSNPTAQWVDLDFYKEVIRIAEKYDLIVLSDIAYSEIYFDEQSAALDPSGRRCHQAQRRDQFAVQDLCHGRLACRHGRRQFGNLRRAWHA